MILAGGNEMSPAHGSKAAKYGLNLQFRAISFVFCNSKITQH